MPSLLPRNMLLIAKREYLEQIRGRAFRFSTILVPFLVIVLVGVSAITGRKMGAGKHIVVACDSAELARDMRSNLLGENRAGYTFETVAPFTDLDRTNLQALVENKSIDGLLTVENSASLTPKVTYYSESSGDLMDTSRLRQRAQ